jgi:hypothetical protein
MKKDDVPDTRCPICGRECVFRWQEFRNGKRHIRQDCPHHGYIKYAPKIEPCLTLANNNKSDSAQTRLF